MTSFPDEHPTEALPVVDPYRARTDSPDDDEGLIDATWQKTAPRRSRLTFWLVVLLVVVLAFWAGIVVGRATAPTGGVRPAQSQAQG